MALSNAFRTSGSWLEAHLQGVLCLFFLSIALALIAGAIIAYANRGSQTLGLGFTGLVGAMALFAGQLFFQLRAPSPIEETVVTQIMVEPNVPRVFPFPDVDTLPDFEPHGDVMRFVLERDAGAWLTHTNPTAFSEPERVVSDLLVFSFVNFLVRLQPDWRMTHAVYTFPAFPGTRTMSQFADPTGSSQIAMVTIRSTLRAANNVFADAPIPFGEKLKLLLPPGCQLQIQRDRLTLAAPTMSLIFRIEPSERVSGIPTKTSHGLEIQQNDGTHDLHLVRITLQATFSALHAQDVHLDMYRAWFARVVDGAREWFKPAGNAL